MYNKSIKRRDMQENNQMGGPGVKWARGCIDLGRCRDIFPFSRNSTRFVVSKTF